MKQEERSRQGYAWSTARVLEQVATNVLTAGCLAAMTAVLAGLGLFAQWITHYIVVPTHILVAVLWIGVGMALVVVALGASVYLYHRKHPYALLGLVVGHVVSDAFNDHQKREGERKDDAGSNEGILETLTEAMKKASANMAQQDSLSSAPERPRPS